MDVWVSPRISRPAITKSTGVYGPNYNRRSDVHAPPGRFFTDFIREISLSFRILHFPFLVRWHFSRACHSGWACNTPENGYCSMK